MNLKEAAKKLHGAVIPTGGDGLWSSSERDVKVSKVEYYKTESTECFPDGEEFLRVFFDRDTWDVMEDGLIYTDRKWIKGLRAKLAEIGYPRAKELDYTEQGMQGEKYVHLIVGSW